MNAEVIAFSSIIIDGYNLIGIDHGDLNRERERLIRMLSGYAKVEGHEIILVFDGWKAGGSVEEAVRTGGIKIIYSRLGEKADLVIKKLIDADKREWIVITSDRDIAAHAWSHGSIPVPSEKFLSIIEKRDRNFTGDYDLLSEEEDEPPRRGKARTPSRKEKSLQRALKKL